MIDRHEIVRYLGARNEDGISDLIDEAVKLASALSPKHIAAELNIISKDDGITLEDGTMLTGELAYNSLKGCSKVIILVATLTLQADRVLNTAGSTLKEAVLNAAFTTRIENYLDLTEEILAAEYLQHGKYLTPRFSPGYGDLPLTLQRSFLSITNAEKLLGIHVTENLMLVPIKSVTAIIGISDRPHDKNKHKCKTCTLQCIYKQL